ncbi:MAG: phospholipase D-like domain-containing protein [Puniceicoccales bacterium]|jgi:cardiolipin synthase|nr:phospholipase D-like domain-containing protein [Puniceicoccales bacterium]
MADNAPDNWLHTLEQFVLPTWQSALGAAVALLVGAILLHRRRRQSNILAWMFFIFAFPLAGTAAFLVFGLRKHQKTVALKRRINCIAGIMTREDDDGSAGIADSAVTGPVRPLLGNSVTLLDDDAGTATWRALRDEIAAARESIHITTYMLGRDDVGRALVEQLAARAREGVAVRLLVDALGSLSAKWGFCRPLVAAGGQVRRFMPLLPFQWRGPTNLRNHRKIALFDGRRAIIGGQNLAERYIGPTPHAGRFRDFSALVSGPAVAELTRVFLSDWCFAGGEHPERYEKQLRFNPEPTGGVRMAIVSGGPDEPGDPLWEQFLTLIQECRKELVIVTPYLVPDEVIFRLLLAKLRAGRRVRLIMPAHSDHPFLDLARRPYLRTLHRAGATVLLYNRGMLHGKMFLVDGGVGVIGSANLDMRSLFVNFEVAGFIYSPNTIRRLRLLANDIAGGCIPYGESHLAPRHLRNRFLEAVAHLAGPLL